jgi:hypothetical protein
MKMIATTATLACALLLAGTAAAEDGSGALSATLSGANEVPGPADPDGSGSARITFVEGAENLCFDIAVRDIGAPTMAHIHTGAAGTGGGPPVVRLGTPVGGVARGCVAAPPAVVAAIRANPAAYFVNIHNAEFPAGAIRGQLGG